MSFLAQGIELPFTNGFYRSRSLQASAQRCIGYYPAVHQAPCLSPETLYMTSGIYQALSELDGVTRGMHTVEDGTPYAVSGTKLYSINRIVNPDLTITWSSTEIGTIAGSDRVIMDSGRTGSSYELVIVVPGVSTYHYDVATNTLSALDGVTNFRSPAEDVCNVFGYFVFLESGTNNLFHSALRDAQTYNALARFDVTQAARLRGVINFRDQLFVFAGNKIIPFNFIGGANFVFQTQFNAVKPYGLRSLHAKSDIGSYLVFLGNPKNSEPAIYAYSGGEPQRISTEPIEEVLQNLTQTQLNNAYIDTYSQGGANFVFILAGDECFVYNLNTGRWHEQRSYINETSRRWRVNAVCQAYNVLLVGDFQSGLIGVLDTRTTTEYGVKIPRSFTLQPFDNKGKYIRVKDLMMFMDVGFDGSMTMEYSDDGGVTWPNNALDRSAGAIGEYGRTLRWDRLGTADAFRTLRFSTDTTAQCHVNKILALA